MPGASLLLLSLAMAEAQPHEVAPPAFKPVAPPAPEGCRDGLKSDGVIRVDRTDYDVVGASCVATQLYIGRLVLSGVVNSTTPLFRYFDRFGNELDPNAAGQSALTFTQAETVRVSVKVQYKTNSPLLSYTSDLALRNNR